MMRSWLRRRTGVPNEKSEAALAPYRAKRNAARPPNPWGTRGRTAAGGDRPVFVIQEHHARALHWDFRLEHEGVLVSWALPKGVPEDPNSNHLAVHTEDHPLEYGSFEGEIPAGEYGGGKVTIWDQGYFDLEKWTPDRSDGRPPWRRESAVAMSCFPRGVRTG